MEEERGKIGLEWVHKPFNAKLGFKDMYCERDLVGHSAAKGPAVVVGFAFGDERYKLDFPYRLCLLRSIVVFIAFRKDISVNYNQNELFLSTRRV